MSLYFANLLGKLSWSQFPSDAITRGGVALMTVIVLGVFAYLVITKRLKWLWKEWLTSLDPKRIGVMYIVVAVLMLARGLSDALMIKAQQSTSVGAAHGIISSNEFQQVVSAHGTIMIFFAGMGLLFGIVNLILPVQLGSRDVAFPFLNSVAFWLFASGMVLINLSLVFGGFAATGWLAYPPLSELQFSPGVGVDYWIWALQIAGIGSLLSGINFFVTILKMRCKGMTLMKMPMFAWSVLGTMTLVMFAFPILTVTLTLLFLDRTMGMHFFTAAGGGNPMMYVNLIWAWGHPEVYILVLPAFGIYSEVVATFSRKKLFGYASMVWAIAAIVFLSFTVWLHHFFTMGAGADVNAFFGIMTMIIAVPTGVKMFNWIFTMYRGRILFATPMLWFLGFVVLFTIGGVAGVMMAVPPIDFQLHNSLFLVAHFHMMIVSGVLFGYFAGLTYWLPKVTGFKLNERLGKYAFWCWAVGFVTAFVPLYILGFMGATRRLDHYSASLGWRPLFAVSGVGVLIVCAGVGFQLLQFVVSFIQKDKNRVGNDPWNGRTLEWSIPSPMPEYNFAVLPEVHGRDPFWEMKRNGAKPSTAYEDISVPKNTGLGVFIAAFAFLLGFGMIWHIWWLVIVGLLGAILAFIVRSSDEHPERIITAAEVAAAEHAYAKEQTA
ncbi:MAG TPA: cbb3-type cytochrome c oxidase subunit I [Candidatus Saccharimonadales bacterium]